MRLPFAGLRPPPELTDRHLLDRFRLQRDEAAFTELVRRHGPLVWGVCRRTLSPTDAEDALQATFLLLLRKLPAGDALAPWLYRVAVLTARTARRAERRRWLRVRVGLPADEPATPVRDDLRDAVDAALMGLSAGDRAAVVLCHLEGHTRAEAAKRLGVPEGTLSARLSRALAKLRLGRDPAAVLAVAGAGLLPAGLEAAAVRAGILYLAGGAVPPAVAIITRGVLAMGVLKSMTVAGLLLVAVAGTGVGVGLRAGPDDKPAEAKSAEVKQAEVMVEQATARLAKLGEDQKSAQAMLEVARQQLATARAKLSGRPERCLALTDVGGVGYDAARFKLTEPTDGEMMDFRTTTVAGLAKLLTMTRTTRPGLQLAVGVQHAATVEQVRELLGLVRSAGFESVHYTGPDLPVVRDLASGPGCAYQEPQEGRFVLSDMVTSVYAENIRFDQPTGKGFTARLRQSVYAGLLDLTKLK